MRLVSQCDYCGEPIEPAAERFGRDPVTCGKRECERWARDAEAEEREQAHRDLDDQRGWS